MSNSSSTRVEPLIQSGPLKLLGGPRVLLAEKRAGVGRSSPARGFPRSFRVKFAAVENLGRFLSEPPQRLMRVIQINERTALRRREHGALSAEESDRIARIARVSQRPNRTLQDRAPLDLLGTDAGSERVTDELGRIEYGDLY
jgi:uncharacterized protein (DUF2384 family)